MCTQRLVRIRFIWLVVGSTFLFSACGKRKSAQEASGSLELFYADQMMFNETSRKTLRSSEHDAAHTSSIESMEVPVIQSPKKTRALMHEQQARLIDIPFPLQATSLERYFNAYEGKVIMGYDVRGYVSDYIALYEQGLERWGWRKITHISNTLESLLVYDKPERYCVVSLRHASVSGNIPIRIMLYTGIKEEGLS